MSAIERSATIPSVLYEDNHLLAVNKPSGMLAQGDETGDKPLTDWAAEYLAVKYKKPGNAFIGLIHRIDRPVSGLVLLARTSKALDRMNEQFRDRHVEKEYRAVVEGCPTQEEEILEHWLVKHSPTNKSKVVGSNVANAKKALLQFRVLQKGERYAMLLVQPNTGRHHQIRVQLSSIGHPVAGDVKYGAKRTLEFAAIALHSYRLAFEHPVTKLKMELTAPLPDHFPWTIFQKHEKNTA
jgi:23S rRNA pseudouridine1911/1915/1917 synthase